MKPTNITVSAESENAARIEGAQILDVGPDDVSIAQVDGDKYRVFLKNAPGQFDIFVKPDKMAVFIKTLTPPSGSGKSVTAEEILHALAGLKITIGIDKDAVETAARNVLKTGASQENILIASGRPAVSGGDGRLELKIGADAVSKDPRARMMVKPGQIIATIVPAPKGTSGRNVFGEEIPARDGADIRFTAGENVNINPEGTAFIAAAYGPVKKTRDNISVTDPIKIVSNQMLARTPIFPLLADDSALAFQDVIRALKQAGVVHGIREDDIKAVLAAGRSVPNLIVAEGTPAKNGVDACIEFRFRLNGDDPRSVDAARQSGQLDEKTVIKELKTSGSVLAIKIRAIEPVEGCTVTGNTLKGVLPRDVMLSAGTNVAVRDDGTTYVVAEGVTGYADYVSGRLRVEDPLWASEDDMQAYLTVQPPSDSGMMLTVELVEKLRADRGIVHGVDPEAVKQALAEAASQGMPIYDTVIADGTPPVHGRDAEVEFKFQTDKTAGTYIGDSDRLDYRERGSIQNVKSGDLLAVKTPPTEGQDGIDVRGLAVPAEPGTDIVLVPGEKVMVSDDGLSFKAEIDGMAAFIDGNRLSVLKQHETSGDVDYSTGNLNVDGALIIRGWIRSGFVVRASGDVHVEGGIEDAVVEAGLNLTVKGGIIGAEEGKVRAGGDIFARFIESIRVHANGNIFVRDNVVRSTLSANGIINVSAGKGRIVSGAVEAVKGLEVNEIGSEAGVKTSVSVGADLTLRLRMDQVSKQLAAFKRQKAKMDMVLARYVKKGKSEAMRKQTALKLAKVAKQRRKAVTAEIRLAKYMHALAERISENGNGKATVTVNKTVYSGTTIAIGGFPYCVSEDIKGKVKFVFDFEKKGVTLIK